jgi:hypothetical protein
MKACLRRTRTLLRWYTRRARRRLSETNPVLVIGVVLFLTGFGLNIVRPPDPDAQGGRVSLPRFLNHVIDTAGTYLPGELTDPAMRERVNILMVAMLSEALPPQTRARLEGLLTISRQWFRELFTLPGLITLVLVVAAYIMLAGWLDRRAKSKS